MLDIIQFKRNVNYFRNLLQKSIFIILDLEFGVLLIILIGMRNN